MSRLTLISRAAVVAAIVAAPAALHAQTTTPTPKVYYACYIPTSGTVYRIKETNLKQACASTAHVPFSWTDGGTPGPEGPKGDKGDTGEQGAPGAPGFSEIFFVTSPLFALAPNDATNSSVSCPDGSKAIGGGYAFKTSNSAMLIRSQTLTQETTFNLGVNNLGTTEDVEYSLSVTCVR